MGSTGDRTDIQTSLYGCVAERKVPDFAVRGISEQAYIGARSGRTHGSFDLQVADRMTATVEDALKSLARLSDRRPLLAFQIDIASQFDRLLGESRTGVYHRSQSCQLASRRDIDIRIAIGDLHRTFTVTLSAEQIAIGRNE